MKKLFIRAFPYMVAFRFSKTGISVAVILFLIAVLMPFGLGATGRYAAKADSAIKVLDREIAARRTHHLSKEQGLAQLKNSLHRAASNATRFELSEDICEEYACYQSDSAFAYALKSYDLAREMGDSSSVHRAYLMLMRCFTSVGLLKESYDMKRKINISFLSDSDRLDFYRQAAGLYFNLTSFLGPDSNISSFYDVQRDFFTDMAIKECAGDSLLADVLTLQRRVFAGMSPAEELDARQSLVESHDLPIHELAMQYCAMGKACSALGNTDAAIYFTAMSAICDQRMCNNETMSTYILADLMHQKGDIERASRYIYAALDEANFFNSRLRKIEINAILPDIADSRLYLFQTQKHVFIIISGIVFALLLWVLLLWLKVRRRNQMLLAAHEESRRQTEMLNVANASLVSINEKLEEADEIKNRCIMESLYANQTFVDMVDKTGRTIERKIKARQFDDINDLLRSMGVKNESRRILSTFDSIFLSIFPAFVESFNALLDCESRLELSEDGSMPTELRIYALMRLGISDTVTVSKYLGISPNTIYVYKARVKAHAIVDKEAFDEAVMNIPR